MDTKGLTVVMDAVMWTLKDRQWLWTQWCGHEMAVSGDGPRHGAVERATRRSVVGVCMQCGCARRVIHTSRREETALWMVVCAGYGQFSHRFS